METQQNNKVIALRVSVMRRITGKNKLTNDDYVGLSPELKIRITNEMKETIASNPDIYGEDRAKLAGSMPDISEPEKFGLKEVVSSAGKGAFSGVKNIVETVKESNKTIKLLAVAAIVLGGVYALTKFRK